MPEIRHLIDTREYNSFAALPNELNFNPEKNYLFDLSFMGCIDLIGEKAAEYLQGQLSCDVREVNSFHMRQGAMCNLKGRVLSLLDVIDWHGIHLLLPKDLIDATQTSLMKTAVFSHVKVETNNAFQLFGFYLQNPLDMIPFNANLPIERYAVATDESFFCYHLGKGYYIFLVKTSDESKLRVQFNNQWRGSLAWHALQLHQHQVTIYPTSRGLFLPHRIDLHKSSYLSFNKGCYKGQEIIARMHYRSKPKHEIKLFTVQSDKPLEFGQQILDQNNMELGEVIDFCPIDEKTYLVAASVLFDCPALLTLNGNTATQLR